ncbi:MAG: hypothetical protein J7521_10090 [Caulobacter sp.]|nr:hypothetical protein [Caulobacter sp.]
MTTLQDLADRLGLEPRFHPTLGGRPRVIFLCIAAALSVLLWAGIGWGAVALFATLFER